MSNISSVPFSGGDNTVGIDGKSYVNLITISSTAAKTEVTANLPLKSGCDTFVICISDPTVKFLIPLFRETVTVFDGIPPLPANI